MSLKCSGFYNSPNSNSPHPHLLAGGDGSKSATIEIYGYKIELMANAILSIGPNVSISANARIGPGARLIRCIILDNVEVMENAVVIYSIVGWNSSIGRWSRVQASEGVTVEDEVVVINSIVLPYKTLDVSVQDEIIL
ncbi:Mannose-1-phosphate guanylyltransferase 1 [Populus alba x Populus x berolinensis]|nr:Mannose-1-phosphate guanylyltransferase 1 [Populus alba x Populus x berolinensis]